MTNTHKGLLCCLAFVTLEAFQAVYLGGLFQSVDSFLIGSLVFGLSVAGTVIAAAIFRPRELVQSYRSIRLVAILNVFAAVTWSTYFLAVQLIEPAVVFTVFSGMVPLGTLIGRWLRMREAGISFNGPVYSSYLLIFASLLALGAATLTGLSGFVRGDVFSAALGVSLSVLSGGCTAFVILYSIRLNGRGVGPLTQFGLRFVLYTLLASAAFAAGLDDKGQRLAAPELALVVAVGLAVIALPLYLVQKAVPLLPASTIAAMTSLGPIMVFLMQMIEGRVDYAPATLFGLAIYSLGALLIVWGAAKPASGSRRR